MLGAYGLYTHIRANRIRSVCLLVGLFVVLYAAILALVALTVPVEGPVSAREYWVAVRPAVLGSLPFVTLLAGGWVGIGFFLNRGIVSLATSSSSVTRQEQPRLYNLLENLCISCGAPMPRLAIIDTDVLNAFASGIGRQQATITVTRGLADTLNDSELEAVLAHELTHIRNDDVSLMMIAIVIVGGFSLASQTLSTLLRISVWSSRGSGNNRRGDGGKWIFMVLIAFAIISVAWLLSTLINFSLSRKREYLADAGAAELTKNADAMIGALQKISGNSDLPAVATGIMQMCVDNPRRNAFDWFATHPSVDDRIKALVKFGGGRMPEPVQPQPQPAVQPEQPAPDSARKGRFGPWGLRRGPWTRS